MEVIYWRKKDGTIIAVDDMTEQHAKNTLKLVLKNIEAAKNKPKPKKTDRIAERFFEDKMNHLNNELEEDTDYPY